MTTAAPRDANGTGGASGANVAGPQGSLHTFSIAGMPDSTGCMPKKAMFNVTVTSAAGSATDIPFKLSFTCP